LGAMCRVISSVAICTVGMHTESILVGLVCLILVVVLTYKRK